MNLNYIARNHKINNHINYSQASRKTNISNGFPNLKKPYDQFKHLKVMNKDLIENKSKKIIDIIKTRSINYNHKIAILIPTSNKDKPWNKAEDTYLYNYTIKTLLETTNKEYTIIFYIGIDTDDKIWLKRENVATIMKLREDRKNIYFKFYKMSNIEKGHVTQMWNRLFNCAYQDKCDYYLQCGDDIIFSTKGWLDDCIRAQKLHDNIGVTGMIDKMNCFVLTQSFVSYKHMQIFGFYFPPTIKNWFCDDWINTVYYSRFYFPLINHYCYNNGGKPRYPPVFPKKDYLGKLIKDGKNRLFAYLTK